MRKLMRGKDDLEQGDLTTEEWYELIERALKICSMHYHDLSKSGISDDGVASIAKWVEIAPAMWQKTYDIINNVLPWRYNVYEVKKVFLYKGLNKDTECYRIAYSPVRKKYREDHIMEYDVFFFANIERDMKMICCRARYELITKNKTAPSLKVVASFRFIPFEEDAFLKHLKKHRKLGLEILEQLEYWLDESRKEMISMANARSAEMCSSVEELKMMQRGILP